MGGIMHKEWLQVKIDPKLKKEFKANAAKNGMNMTVAVETIIRRISDGEIELKPKTI